MIWSIHQNVLENILIVLHKNKVTSSKPAKMTSSKPAKMTSHASLHPMA